MRKLAGALVVMVVATPPAAHALLFGDARTGARIHAENCQGCHDERVYTRTDRRVRTIEGLIGQVNFCNRQLARNLNREHINDIIKYLNDAYYRFE